MQIPTSDNSVKATEETGVLEYGEITSSVRLTSVNTIAAQSIQQSTAQSNSESNVARGTIQCRGQRSFYLSQGFRPNISTIRVLLLGTKCIPKWKFEKRNNAFKNFNDFMRRMPNKEYFTYTKPGVFKKNLKFKIKLTLSQIPSIKR